MPKAGLIISILAVLVVGAAGVLYYSNFFDGGGTSQLSQTIVAPPNNAPSEDSNERKWVQDMVESVGMNGFAATFSDKDVSKWALSSGHRLERFAVDGKGTVFARLSSDAAISPQTLLDGVFAELPNAFGNYSAGRTIEVGVVARMPTANPADKFSVIYLTRQAGNSGWRTFALTGEFQLFKFEYNVPQVEGGFTVSPMAAIYGDPSGGGKGVELLGVYVKLKP